MKLITLNIWGGIVYKPLLEFIEANAGDTDIFCFQEVLFGTRPEFTTELRARQNIFHEIAHRLPEFVSYKYIADQAKYFQFELLDGFHGGQAIFVRKHLSVIADGGFRGYQEDVPDSVFSGKITGSCQWVELRSKHGAVTLANLHGLWQRDTHKTDTPARLVQSEIIRDFFRGRDGKKILCGDFNLAPDTKSIAILEKEMKNLVKEYGVSTTRSHLYTKDEKYADYILTSRDVRVKEFRVLQDVVSDHLPLLTEFE